MQQTGIECYSEDCPNSHPCRVIFYPKMDDLTLNLLQLFFCPFGQFSPVTLLGYAIVDCI